MRASGTPPGAPPEVDPLTPEGQQKIAEFYAQKAQAQANAPLLQRKAEIDRQQRWDAIRDQYPALSDAKVLDEFNVYVKGLNEGIDPTKEKPRVPTAQAAEMFFNRRELDELRAAQAKAKTAQASDRQAAARSIGRVTSGGTSSPTAPYHALIRKGDIEGAVRLLETNPTLKAAVSRENGIGA